MGFKKQALTQSRGEGNTQHSGEKRVQDDSCVAGMRTRSSCSQGDFSKNRKLIEHLMCLNVLRRNSYNWRRT